MEPRGPRLLVRDVQELAPVSWPEVPGGTSWRTLFAQEATGTDAMTAGVAVVPPGGWWPAHRHPVAECYYVLRGEGLMLLGDERHRVAAGSSVMIPAGERHGLENTGPDPLEFFYVFPVSSPGDVTYEFDPGGR